MVIGIPFGILLEFSMGNMAFGLPIGLCFVFVIAAAWEKKHEKELRPLTKQEKEMKKKSIYYAIALLVVGVIVFAATFLINI